MKALTVIRSAALLWSVFLACASAHANPNSAPAEGHASWYGEAHRGKRMANGRPFDPDRFTAASWFYPLGTKVLVTRAGPERSPRSLVVTITDRGPAHRLVEQGRVVDLSHAAFKVLGKPEAGLVRVKLQPLN